MRKKLLTVLVCSAVSLSALAHSKAESKFYVGGSLGYNQLAGTYSTQDGSSAAGRLDLGVDVWQRGLVTLGTELGIQNGNTQRFASVAPANSFPLPLQTTLKPVVDILVTSKIQFKEDSAWYGVMKLGAAYRSLVTTSGAVNSINQISPELQAGLGYQLTEKARLSAYYQIIYSGSSAGLSQSADQSSGSFARIPTQQGGFVGFEYGLN